METQTILRQAGTRVSIPLRNPITGEMTSISGVVVEDEQPGSVITYVELDHIPGHTHLVKRHNLQGE